MAALPCKYQNGASAQIYSFYLRSFASSMHKRSLRIPLRASCSETFEYAKYSSANEFPHDMQNSDKTDESQAHHQYCNRRNLQARTFVSVKLDHASTSLARASLGPCSCECFVHGSIRCNKVSHVSRLEATSPLSSFRIAETHSRIERDQRTYALQGYSGCTE